MENKRERKEVRKNWTSGVDMVERCQRKDAHNENTRREKVKTKERRKNEDKESDNDVGEVKDMENRGNKKHREGMARRKTYNV